MSELKETECKHEWEELGWSGFHGWRLVCRCSKCGLSCVLDSDKKYKKMEDCTTIAKLDIDKGDK